MPDSHVHAATAGMADPDVIRSAALSAGFGERFSFSPMQDAMDYSLYIVKVPRYANLNEDSWERAQRFLALNGNRLRHATRDFWPRAAPSLHQEG
jgi:hypothetical protein